MDEARSRALQSLAASTRRLVSATIRTGRDAGGLASMAGQIDQVSAMLEREIDDTFVQDDPFAWEADNIPASFNPITGSCNPVAPPLEITEAGKEGVCAKGILGAAYEGPPGHVHGGVLAAILDQILGMANRAAGHSGMTASLAVDYRLPTPVGAELTMMGCHGGVDGRKIEASGRIMADGIVTCEAKGLFVSLKPETYDSYFGRRLFPKGSS